MIDNGEKNHRVLKSGPLPLEWCTVSDCHPEQFFERSGGKRSLSQGNRLLQDLDMSSVGCERSFAIDELDGDRRHNNGARMPFDICDFRMYFAAASFVLSDPMLLKFAGGWQGKVKLNSDFG